MHPSTPQQGGQPNLDRPHPLQRGRAEVRSQLSTRSQTPRTRKGGARVLPRGPGQLPTGQRNRLLMVPPAPKSSGYLRSLSSRAPLDTAPSTTAGLGRGSPLADNALRSVMSTANWALWYNGSPEATTSTANSSEAATSTFISRRLALHQVLEPHCATVQNKGKQLGDAPDCPGALHMDVCRQRCGTNHNLSETANEPG